MADVPGMESSSGSEQGDSGDSFTYDPAQQYHPFLIHWNVVDTAQEEVEEETGEIPEVLQRHCTVMCRGAAFVVGGSDRGGKCTRGVVCLRDPTQGGGPPTGGGDDAPASPAAAAAADPAPPEAPSAPLSPLAPLDPPSPEPSPEMPSTPAWHLSHAPPTPAPLRSRSVVAWRGWLVAFGGAADLLRVSGDLDAFDAEEWLRTGAGVGWARLPAAGDAPAPRANHAAAVVGDEMIVWGGWRGGETLADLWSLDLVARRWSRVEPAAAAGADPPRATSNHAACAVAGCAVFFGGVVRGAHSAQLCSYSPADRVWRDLSPAGWRVLNPASNASAAALDATRCVFVGGWDQQKRWTTQCVLYDHAAGCCRALTAAGVPPAPSWRCQVVYVPHEETLLSVGTGVRRPHVARCARFHRPARSLKELVRRHIVRERVPYAVAGDAPARPRLLAPPVAVPPDAGRSGLNPFAPEWRPAGAAAGPPQPEPSAPPAAGAAGAAGTGSPPHLYADAPSAWLADHNKSVV